ncbi:SRPBCC domain-containing protein [candidate division KSB1 bacterium]|nr:SRPBCC domain-containing protein [candidate division KSB1 bacterium]
MANGSETTLNLKRTFNAPREKVFRAWTDPTALKEWFHGMDDWTTPVHEIDLQVGGKYRLGMQPPDGDTPYVAYGTYREVQRRKSWFIPGAGKVRIQWKHWSPWNFGRSAIRRKLN